MDRPTVGKHCEWLAEHADDSSFKAAISRYDLASGSALSSIEASEFWQFFLGNLSELGDKYYQQTSGFQLLTSIEPPELCRKTAGSLQDKVFRKNVIMNKNYPDAPSCGWITPRNWYEQVNDIVRTTLIVKYLDGVEYLAEAIASVAKTLGLNRHTDFEAREQGYYAAHVYVTFPLHIPGPSWDPQQVNMRLEIQIATQLQDAIRKLTHENYVARRSLDQSLIKWQWDYNSPQFTPNYLGHILHYVEGMIMEVRNRRPAAND